MKTLIKNNKHLFILPLPALPFLLLIFYVLGGGTGDGQNPQTQHADGANYGLPDANRGINILEKKEAYQRMEAQESPIEVKLDVDTASYLTPLEEAGELPKENANQILLAHVRQQEQMAKLAMGENEAGKKEINSNDKSDEINNKRKKKESISHTNAKRTPCQSSPEKLRLDYTDNPGIEELEDMFEQHGRLMMYNDSLSQEIALLQQEVQKHQKPARTFFEVKPDSYKSFGSESNNDQSIKAQVMEDCKVTTGMRIMMRLLEDTKVNGKTVKANTLVYGLCKVDNERLQIHIGSIQGHTDGLYIPVSLSAYDLDGIQGVYVPDNVVRKVYKDVAGGVNPSVMMSPGGNPLGYMGINAANDVAKGLFKTLRLKKVFLRQNTVVILRND